MKQLTGTQAQENTAGQIAAIGKPAEGANNVASIDPSQPTTFLFSATNIAGYTLGGNGELVIRFTDSSSLTIQNFKALADAGFVAKLQDGTTLAFADIATDIGAGKTAEAAINLDFAANDVKAVVAEDGKLTITLNNGEVRVIDYDESHQPVLTFADGKSILPSDLVHQYETALNETQPAAGENAQQLAAAQTAEALAAIEPAAGPTAGAGDGSANFGSRIQAANIDPLDDVGPIDPTELAFGLPAPETAIPQLIVTPAAVVLPNAPAVGATDTPTNEDTSVGLQVTGSPSVTDGSEYITVQIVGIPTTWTITDFQGGVYDPTTGIWTIQLPPGVSFSGGPTILPPANSDVDLPLTVIVTTTNTTTNLSNSSSDNFTVVVDAVVDTPTVSVTNTTVAEDNVAPINISAAVTDTDGSESVTQVVITGVPAGFTLSAGTFNSATNTWTLTGPQLAGLTMTSPANYSGTVNLNAQITVFDNPTDGELTLTNNTYTTTQPITVTWTPVADAPVLSAGVAQVYEDGSVTLAASATLVDRDGSESMTVQIVGIPSTWTITALNGGTYNAATQTWSITLPAGADFTGGPTIAPPANSDIDLPLTLRATTTDGTDTATSTTPFTVVVDAVADGVNLAASSAFGVAGTPIPLTLTTSLKDVDTSEEITTINLTGIPSGVTLNQGTLNADGSWTLTLAQLTGLTITTPAGFAGNFPVTMTVNSREKVTDTDFDLTNNTASNSTTFTVGVDFDAVPPTINVNGGADGQVYEDQSVVLPVSVIGNGTTDETMVVTISNLPAGWTIDPSGLTGGTVAYTAGGTSITVTLPANTNLGGSIRFTPPANSDVDSPSITITAVATEPSVGDSATSTDTFIVEVDAVADAPNLTVTNATGTEDTPIALAIASSLADTDGSEALSIRISGLPSGATLSAGTNLGGGVWSVSPAQLAGLSLNPPVNFSGTIALTVTSTATETALNGVDFDLTNNVATTTRTLNVTVNPSADDPSLTINNAQVYEDQSVTLNLTAAPTDTSESVTVSIGNLNGWTVTALNGGTYNAATGVWTITMPVGATFTGGPTVAPPANSDVNRDLSVTVVTTDGASTKTTTGTLAVVVDAVADGVNLSATGGSAAQGSPVAVNVATSLKDTDGSEEITTVTITGVPSNVALSAGTKNADGSWTLTTGQLAGLNATSNGYTGTFTGTVTVNSREKVTDTDFDLTNNTASNSTTFTVGFTPTAQPPVITVNGGAQGEVYEDSFVIVPVTVVGQGSNQETMVVTITNLPAGWAIDPSGLTGGPISYAPGGSTITVTLPANTNLGGSIRFAPPANSDADASGIIVSAVATEPSSGTTANASTPFTIITDAVADQPNLTVTNAAGDEDSAIPLTISSSLVDTDGSETLSLKITGVPAGANLSAGTKNADGSWSLTQAQLAGLKITPAANFSGTILLTVTANAHEGATGTTELTLANNDATRSANITVTVNPVADVPTLTVNNAQVYEDQSVTLSVQAAPTDSSEALTIQIGNLQGWSVTALNGGTYNAATGVWSITLGAGQSFNGGPTVAPPANSDINRTLPVTVTSTDGTSTANATGNLNVVVDAVADGVNLSAGDVSGNGTVPLTMNLSTSLKDTDGSEEITSIKLTGIPNGFTLSAGTKNADGSWSLTSGQLAGLTITAPSGYSGSFTGQMVVESREKVAVDSDFDLTNNTATNSDPFTVTIQGPAVPPTVNVDGNQQVYEDGSVSVPISVTGNGSTSETMVVTVTGIPSGWGVNTNGVGSYAGGVWTITLPANTNFNGAVRLTPPANSDVDSPTITVRAVASEPNGTTAQGTDTFVVVVDAVADGTNVNAGADATAARGDSVALNFSTSLKDTDGSEEITSVTVSGIPSGLSLSAGTNLGGGQWQLTPAQLSGLRILGGGTYTGSFNATLTVNSREKVTDSDFDFSNNTASNSDSVNITFTAPQLPPPTVDVTTGVGGSGSGSTYEDTAFTVPFSAAVSNGSGNETMTVTVSGIPSNWGVNTNGQGSYNAAAGTWTITLPAGQLSFSNSALQLTPPLNSQADLNLNVRATVSDPDNAGASITDSAGLPIIVDAVVDGIDIVPPSAPVDVWIYIVPGAPTDRTFAANFNVSHRDNDGSETTTAQIIGPNAHMFSSFNYSDGQLVGQLSSSADYAAPFQITVRFTTYDHVQDGELTLANNETYRDVTITVNPVTIYTPLALDLDGNGIEYRSINDGVTFDVNGDGDKEKTAWIGGNDALLAIDNNHDGLINGITELFGQDNGAHKDGFAKLSTYDSNGDGKIDASDEVYSQLKLWTDTNGDGISQADELHGLLDFGIASINLNATQVFEVIGSDKGVVTSKSSFTTTDGATHDIVDISFTYKDDALTQAINEFVNKPDTPPASTPTPDAHHAPTANDNAGGGSAGALADLDDASKAAQGAA